MGDYRFDENRRDLEQGGPTFCSWRANLHFHKNTGGRQMKKIILLPIYILFYIIHK